MSLKNYFPFDVRPAWVATFFAFSCGAKVKQTKKQQQQQTIFDQFHPVFQTIPGERLRNCPWGKITPTVQILCRGKRFNYTSCVIHMRLESARKKSLASEPQLLVCQKAGTDTPGKCWMKKVTTAVGKSASGAVCYLVHIPWHAQCLSP